MRKNISLKELESIEQLLLMLRKVGLLEPIDYIIQWEQKPKLIINQMGNFEFENPQETYGCTITFWSQVSYFEVEEVSKTRFKIVEDI